MPERIAVFVITEKKLSNPAIRPTVKNAIRNRMTAKKAPGSFVGFLVWAGQKMWKSAVDPQVLSVGGSEAPRPQGGASGKCRYD